MLFLLVHPAICDECGNHHERKGSDYHPYSSLGRIAHQEFVRTQMSVSDTSADTVTKPMPSWGSSNRAQTRTIIRIKAGVALIEPPTKSQGAGGPTNLVLSA